MTKIMLAKPLIEDKLSDLSDQCKELAQKGLKPKLEVIIVGKLPASVLYVKNKKRLCKKVGADFSLVELPEDISKEDFLSAVKRMNEDDTVTGCFVQLPVPLHLRDINITELINPKKDVDGFHSKSIIATYNNRPGLVSCTPKGIIELLSFYGHKVEGKNITIIGRGFIVGKPLSLLLQNLNATVSLCHLKTRDIRLFTKISDIIIIAIGHARFLDSSFLSEKKDQVIVDVGINKDSEGNLCGDTNFEEIKDKVQAITPVPGGVGPMTVYSLINNLILSTKNILEERNS